MSGFSSKDSRVDTVFGRELSVWNRAGNLICFSASGLHTSSFMKGLRGLRGGLVLVPSCDGGLDRGVMRDSQGDTWRSCGLSDWYDMSVTIQVWDTSSLEAGLRADWTWTGLLDASPCDSATMRLSLNCIAGTTGFDLLQIILWAISSPLSTSYPWNQLACSTMTKRSRQEVLQGVDSFVM